MCASRELGGDQQRQAPSCYCTRPGLLDAINSVPGVGQCGSLRITELYRINNKKCGFLQPRDSLESSELTAKTGLNSAQQRISEIQQLERSSRGACMPGRSQPLKALRALEPLGAAPRGHGVAGGDGAPAHTSAAVSGCPPWFTQLGPT